MNNFLKNKGKKIRHTKIHFLDKCLLILSALSLTLCSSVFANNAISETIDKEWRSAMLIYHPYSTNLDQANNTVNLSVSNNGQPVFEVSSRETKENIQPQEILWTIEVEPETKFFRMKNLKSDLYLSRVHGSTQVILINKPPREHILSQWFVQALTIEGDYAIVNRSGNQQYALNIDDSFSATQIGNKAPVTLARINNLQSTGFMYRMNSRSLDMALYPLDIELGTCLIFLPAGMPLESFTNPAPSRYFSGSVTRRYNIEIKGSGSDVYHFIDGLGFNPLDNNLTADQSTLLVDLISRISTLKIVVDNNLNTEEVFQSFLQQLSDAFLNNESISILYFPESYAAIEADKAVGKIEKKHIIINEKKLGMKVSIHERLSSSYSYGLLVKKVNTDGLEEIIIVDPTDTSSPAKPRL